MPTPGGYSSVSFFNLSGDPTLDAFINFQYKWGAGAVGTAVTVTYSFPQVGASWAAGYGEGEPGGLTGFNAAQQAAATAALNLWSEVANITFEKVDESPTEVGDIRFGFSSVVSNDPYAIAWGYFPYPSPEAGDVWLDPAYGPNLQMQPGGFGFSTLLHEIGHAIGLDHPFDDGYGEPVLPGWQDNMQYTVMAYDPHPHPSIRIDPMTPMLLDILAIQYLYGANMTTRAGDDVYTFANGAQTLKAIWDAGGNDTIDASNQTRWVGISLTEGTFSTIGNFAGEVTLDNVAIAYGVTIENAKGGFGDDGIAGNHVANKLYGNAGNDDLSGYAGDDLLDGGVGSDRLYGGSGNDFYFVDSTGDTIDEQGNTDTADQVFSSVSVNLATLGNGAIEKVILTTAAAANIVGNNSHNFLAGGAGANNISGAGGDDFLFGLDGNDTLSDTTGSNYMEGGAGNDTMTGGAGTDAMYGGDGNDIMNSGAGSVNYLEGGAGNDQMTGGTGNDTLLGGDGIDTLTGNGGADFLDGGAGDDVMIGGQGADIYVVDSAGDKVIETGTDGPDEIRTLFNINLSSFGGGVFEHTRLLGNANLNAIGNSAFNLLWGNGASNVLMGLDGGDLLDGGLGADLMRGGTGNDIYVVENAGDIVDEEGNQDLGDTVMGIMSFDLNTFSSGSMENAILLGHTALNAIGSKLDNQLIGGSGANTLTGNGGNDTLIGNEGDDTLLGGDGNDIVHGGLGKDMLKGGAGNDTYYVDNIDDVVDEEGNTDTNDTVTADASFILPVGIENATLIGTGNHYLTGNNANNILTGNGASNIIDGGGGDDVMRGGAGSDTYTIDSLGDVIDEQGNKDTGDEVRSSLLSLNLKTLAGGALEHARLSGTLDLDITGTDAQNLLFGNDGDNTIDAGAGDDLLLGGAGNDVLISGTGNDQLFGDFGDDLFIVPTIAPGQVLNGGSDFDEIKITTTGANINLTSISDSALTEIESIDLTGAGNNTFTASALDIKSALTGGTDFFVKGNAGDSVVLTNTAWHAGAITVNGHNYQKYSYGTSFVYVEDGVSVSSTPPAQITLGTVPGFRIAGSSTFATGHTTRFGTIVSGVGDFNDDGFEDVLISSGRDVAYLLYGQADAFPTKFSADSVIGTDMAELAGSAGSWTGKSFSGLGDFNGDGNLDLAIGASNDDLNGTDSGGVYVVYGSGAGTLGHESLPAMAGSDGFVVEGPGAGARVASYFAVQGGGDFNGDGYDDLLVATPDASTPADRAAYVIFGASTMPDITLPTLGSSGGFKFTAASGSQIGGSMASAGDLNGDGYDDVVISNSSKSFVVFGGRNVPPSITAESLDGSNGFALSAGVTVLASGGDFNGDGYDDVVIADRWNDKAYVVFGKAGGFSASLDLTTLNGSNGFIVQADAIGSTGNGVSLTGDYNADGYDDLLVGAPTDGAGFALLIYGHAGTTDSLVTAGEIDGYNGLKIVSDTNGQYIGAGVASSDVNGDGFDDILIGSAFGDGDSTDSGTLDVIYGGDFRNNGVTIGTSGDNTLNGTSAANRIAGAQGDDIINGGGGADAINAGQGNDEIHVANNAFFRIDGGTGVDTLHLDYAGAIDFGNLDGNASTSDRGRIENVEIIDVANGQANAMTLHIADVLDIDATLSDVGGVAALDNVLRIDGEAGDTLQLFSADGWGAADTSSLSGYAIYTYQAVKVAVDTDIVVTVA